MWKKKSQRRNCVLILPFKFWSSLMHFSDTDPRSRSFFSFPAIGTKNERSSKKPTKWKRLKLQFTTSNLSPSIEVVNGFTQKGCPRPKTSKRRVKSWKEKSQHKTDTHTFYTSRSHSIGNSIPSEPEAH